MLAREQGERRRLSGSSARNLGSVISVSLSPQFGFGVFLWAGLRTVERTDLTMVAGYAVTEGSPRCEATFYLRERH